MKTTKELLEESYKLLEEAKRSSAKRAKAWEALKKESEVLDKQIESVLGPKPSK